MNLFLAAYLLFTDQVESDPSWGLGDEWHQILGPVWRIVIASIVAMVVSELIDTEVYHWFVTRVTTRYQWARVLVSNAVSLPIDNLIFAVGAFGALPFLTDASGTLPWDDGVEHLLGEPVGEGPRERALDAAHLRHAVTLRERAPSSAGAGARRRQALTFSTTSSARSGRRWARA